MTEQTNKMRRLKRLVNKLSNLNLLVNTTEEWGDAEITTPSEILRLHRDNRWPRITLAQAEEGLTPLSEYLDPGADWQSQEAWEYAVLGFGRQVSVLEKIKAKR